MRKKSTARPLKMIIYGKQMKANLAIHSHSSLTLSGPSLRVPRLLRLFPPLLRF
jgi:hypothetical protein